MKTLRACRGIRRSFASAAWQRSPLAVLHNHRGISIIEILLAGFVMAVVSISALQFYQSQHGQFIRQSDVADTQQSLRATMDELTRKIRLAGYRVYGQTAIMTLSDDTWLALRYHDGDSVRTELFFLLQNSLTGRTDLMTQMNGQAMQVFAEGIDSVLFTPGGTGGGTEWITIRLVAKSANEGFQTAGASKSGQHLYRRLTSTINLRNR